jgi:putative transposase
MLTTFINTLMSAEADAVCGAPYGESSPERTNVRNGYRHREFDTRAGTLDVAIPKLREGSYFPDWLLERRRRAERALTTVVATCYLLGVSTRRMEKLVDALGITRLSKSQVSVMAAELDATVAEFRARPLDQGPYTFVAADALVLKVREGGRVVNVHALIATGVNADGHREILGLQVTSAEDGAGWLAFFRDLTARGLTGVQLVTSDAHAGLVTAIGATLPGAGWQRCRTHWACKGSSCRRVGGGLGTCNGGKERGCGGEPLLGGHWDVADLLKNHGDLAGRGAEGAPADLEQLGERLVAA